MTRTTVAVGTAFAVFAATVSFVITLAASSLKTTVQVYYVSIADSFEVNRGTLAVATTLFAVFTGVMSAVVGYLADRAGAILVIAMGTALVGVVFIASAGVDNIWGFIVIYGVAGAIGLTMLSYVPLGVLADQLFRQRNAGLVYAMLTNGAAVGFIVLVPLWSYLGGTMRWDQVMFGIGVVFVVVLLPLSLVLVRIAGKRKVAAAPAKRASLLEAAAITFRHPQARVLVLAFIGCGTTMAFIDVHLFPHLHDHNVSSSVSSAAMVVLGALEIGGSLVAGRLCDLGWIRGTLVAGYTLRAIAMVMLLLTTSPVGVILFGAVFGASYLVTVIATTVWVSRVLPAGTRGTALGVLWTMHMLATAASSQFGAMLADRQHHYLTTISVLAILVAGSAVLVAFQPSPPPPAPQSEPAEPMPAEQPA